MHQLYLMLNQKHPLSNMNIYQWIIYGRITNYNVDLNGRVYFTKAQAKLIKDQYMYKPNNYYINNQSLAQKLTIDENTLINFRRKYHIPVQKVLGEKNVYYTKENAEKIINWWHNKSERPFYSRYQHPDQ